MSAFEGSRPCSSLKERSNAFSLALSASILNLVEVSEVELGEGERWRGR